MLTNLILKKDKIIYKTNKITRKVKKNIKNN